jgi:hypothetical protein
MKISNSNIDLFSRHRAEEHRQQHQQLRVWRDAETPRETPATSVQSDPRRIEGPAEAGQPAISQPGRAMQPGKALVPEDAELSAIDALEVSVLKLLVERITGRKFDLFDPRSLETNTTETPIEAPTSEPAGTTQRQGWGLVYDAYESHYESESMHFSATGRVHTQDGREIEIQLELNLSREFFSERRLNLRAGDALQDPLVINFDGNAAQLTRNKFRFDLDRDGRAEQISFVQPGSGFLALDRNRDGIVNDGGELFGPTSNDGFRELAAYDRDGNHWIDENDAVYEHLRIWSKDTEGNDRLIGLGQQGIGAIYLGHIDTPFKLADQQNSALGQTRQTGLYVDEDGAAGTIQQVDLVI